MPLAIKYGVGGISDPTWTEIIQDEEQKPDFKKLIQFLSTEYVNHPEGINPPWDRVFRPFEITIFDNIKVVIVGQDPYPRFGQGDGFGFSLNPNEDITTSIDVIYSALEEDDVEFIRPNHGCLRPWALQGVLLLDAVLTYRKNENNTGGSFPNQRKNLHFGKGWETFVGSILKKLSKEHTNLVFLLWGTDAADVGRSIENEQDQHKILSAIHPIAHTYSDSNYTHWNYEKCFSETNNYLRSHGKGEINWQLPLTCEDL
ncbi:uncharacterized protein LOC115886636 [Sitophilus oryzae]|uniref:Uncharacterized protein LOC115886636 n=1 Tax=Sitophilus oryzae TaxID=7048 RepID=A0A6J2YCY3_SITOR|nr:uncharacterized protein LOC115886636 [Sitophilus oryzae]